MLVVGVAGKSNKTQRRNRPPRIRVPNNERALFSVDSARFVGVIQRLSRTGGSAVLGKGPIPHGSMGILELITVFGKVTAQVEFLQTGADGVPLAQAFRFLMMDDESARRFQAAAQEMEAAGFSDVEAKTSSEALPSLSKLLQSVRRLAATMTTNR
jgi:hypothetical protein